MLGLASTLTLLLAAVAGLGVFNTVLLNTRERVHEIGVLKTIGITPAQTQAMIVSAMATVGVIAGTLAVPVGWALHRSVLPAMGDSFGTRLPSVVRDVYQPGLLIGLVAAGAAIAILGSLIPAGWAARTHPVAALRAE